MKKIMIALGIAFAFICGVLIGTNINVDADAEEISATDRIEALACDYIAEEYPDRSIEDIELKRIEKDKYHGGYRAEFAYWFDGGTISFYSINMGVLHD